MFLLARSLHNVADVIYDPFGHEVLAKLDPLRYNTNNKLNSDFCFINKLTFPFWLSRDFCASPAIVAPTPCDAGAMILTRRSQRPYQPLDVTIKLFGLKKDKIPRPLVGVSAI